MDSVKWALELIDKVSPAGKKIAGTFGKFTDAAKKLGDKGLKVATKGLTALGDKIVEVAPKVAKWAALGLATATGGLIVAGGKLVADAIGFKDSTLIATRALLKSDQAAAGAYKRMLDFAHYFGEDPTDAIKRFNNALASGFSASDAEKLLQAFGDLKLVTPNINPDALVGAFGAIRAKAKLELGDFQSAVSAAGLNLTLAYEAIGKKIGKNAKEVEMLIGSGRVNAQVGLIGLLDAINQRTNSTKTGEKLAEYANTASGLVEKLKNLPQQFALRLTADDSPLKGTLQKLLGELDPDGPNGKRIIGALDTAFTKIGGLLQSWATPEGIEKLSKTLSGVLDAAPKIIKALGIVGGAVITVTDAFTGFGDNVRFLWAEFKRGSVILGGWAASVVAGLNPIMGLGIWIYSVGKSVADAVPKIATALGDLVTRAKNWGGNVADGFLEGIKARWANVISKLKGLLDLLPDAAKKALGIASPAKKFMPVGRWSAEGVGAGFVGALPSVNDTISDGLQGTVASGLASVSNMTMSSTRSMADNSRRSSIQFGDIIVQEARNARDMARGFGREMTRQLELANLGGV